MARSYVHEARKRVGPKRERVVPVIERLAAEHPDATIALRFRNDLELLVSVMLSAQTTDVNVNRVTERLFEKYRRPEDYLAVPVEELENDIRPTGFFRQKTKSLRGTMAKLTEEFGGEVPRRLDELLRLPGVARKTANVVVAERGEAEGIVVDTHVRRLSQRLGFTRQKDPLPLRPDPSPRFGDVTASHQPRRRGPAQTRFSAGQSAQTNSSGVGRNSPSWITAIAADSSASRAGASSTL